VPFKTNNRTRKQPSQLDYEEYLNDFYGEQNNEDVQAQLAYLTVPSKVSKFAQLRRLKTSIENKHAGAMLRKYDPAAFSLGYAKYKFEY